MGEKILDLRLAQAHQQRLLDEAGGRLGPIRERLLESARQERISTRERILLSLKRLSWQTVVKLGGATAAGVIIGLIWAQ